MTWTKRPAVILLLISAAAVLAVPCYWLATNTRPYVGLEKSWAIGIYAGSSPLDLAPFQGASNPVLTRVDVTDVKAGFVADPFMVRHGDTWYLFFEVLNAASSHGDIGYAVSTDGLAWSYGGIVLDEPFHLSYPYVFEWQADIYMIPETHERASVRLYTAEAFPGTWRYLDTLLEGEAFVDSSLLRHDDRWWLFTGVGNGTLRLFHSDSLLDGWQEHPSSPVVRNDARIARPAGRPIEFGGRIFRFGQDDSGLYGVSVSAFEILKLTTTRYEEGPASASPIIGATGSGWNSTGMHHVDPHPLAGGGWIASVDGYRTRLAVGLR